MEYVIETQALTKRFPGKLAVNAIDLHVNKGDIYGLIGKNGAGKTTAMKMILGTVTPTSGAIRLFGEDDPSKERMRVGSLIEAPGLYKNCSAYENMKRFSILYGGSDGEIKELLDFVGLGGAGKKKTGQFSLGMKQRLGIALALLGDPELLILDEPINGLDPAGIKEIRDLIVRLDVEKGVTFLISSHLLDELGKIATKYGILKDGVLVEEIEAAELMKSCRSGLTIRVNDPQKAVALLRENGFEDVFADGDTICVNGDVGNLSAVNELLVRGGAGVYELSARNADVEDFFIERMG